MRASKPQTVASAQRSAGSILIADDNANNRELLAQLVALLGHQVRTAENGRQALACLRQQAADLVLLDVLMPEMDGVTALREIKADAQLQAIPVIMVSGLDEVASVVRCIEEGAEDYLTKPFDPVILGARINAWLEKKWLRDAERSHAEELERALQQVKAAQDQLVAHQKLASLGTLTAGIAHEIRNPLNFVINFAQLAVELVGELREQIGSVRGEAGDILSALEQNVAKIEEHGRRANDIVQSMLLHARGQPDRRQRTDLNALVGKYANLAYHGMRGQDSSFHAELETHFDSTVPPLEVSPQDLSRVIINLTHNACFAAHQKQRKAGPGFQPRVVLRTRNLEEAVEVRVWDNGDGVPAALRDKIFTPFFTTKPAGVGTGLGLSISYDIVVRMHKGSLRLETQEGDHAEFIMTLPKDA